MARHNIDTDNIISTVNPPISNAAHISIFVVLISKLNENITEMCQNFFTARIVKKVDEIIILFAFFPTIASKYIYQFSEKTLFSSLFYILGLRDPHFPEMIFFCFLELSCIPFIKSGKSKSNAIVNRSDLIRSAVLITMFMKTCRGQR